MTSIHAMKPKVKNKVVITESTTINAGTNDSRVSEAIPHSGNILHKGDGNIDGGHSIVDSHVLSPSNVYPKKGEGEISSIKPALDKKKLEVRKKKSLKRL
mgnify:FL=1